MRKKISNQYDPRAIGDITNRSVAETSIQYKLACWIYRVLMRITALIIRLPYEKCCRKPASKLSKFIVGQKGTAAALQNLKLDPDKKTVWIHASSYGEFAIARPIIASLSDRNIVISFFSPSGYEPVKQSGTFCNVLYLPFDIPQNVATFLDAVKPNIAVFMVSELWHGYLEGLKSRGIPTILVSALIRNDSVFFKPFGILHRSMIKMFNRIFCLNQQSCVNMKRLGVSDYTLSGDPLFDNAYQIGKREYVNPIVERFAADGQLFVAGSIDADEDLRLVASLANQEKSLKCLIIPHTISREILYQIKAALKGDSMLYSECDEDTDFSDVQTLIIDYFGELPYLYRYGTWAYVGGGFTNFLHSIIEPVVYGIPVCFGPKIKRKSTAVELIKNGIGSVVCNNKDIKNWFDGIKDDTEKLIKIQRDALSYVKSHLGATEVITGEIKRLT